jgi:hypothetical protein
MFKNKYTGNFYINAAVIIAPELNICDTYNKVIIIKTNF